MKKYTERINGRAAIPLRPVARGEDGPRWTLTSGGGMNAKYLTGDAAERLAAYEDTGLAPEGVLVQKSLYANAAKYENATCDCDTGELLVSPDTVREWVSAYMTGRMQVLPCKVGDKVRDLRADHVFTVQTIELGHPAGVVFRCGNPGTEDYMAFYDFEIGKEIEVLGSVGEQHG